MKIGSNFRNFYSIFDIKIIVFGLTLLTAAGCIGESDYDDDCPFDSNKKHQGNCVCGVAEGACIENCVPECSGKECGDDGCGGSCGQCANDQSCVEGMCKEEECVLGAVVSACSAPTPICGPESRCTNFRWVEPISTLQKSGNPKLIPRCGRNGYVRLSR